MALPRRRRLRKPAQFRQTFSRGSRKGDRLLYVVAAPGTGRETKYGLAVSSKVGNAVCRNTIKRRLREILRKLETNGAWDIVVSARPPAAKASYPQLEKSMLAIAYRLKIARKTSHTPRNATT